MRTGELVAVLTAGGSVALGLIGFWRQARVDRTAKAANDRATQLHERTQAFDELDRLNLRLREQMRDLESQNQLILQREQTSTTDREKLRKDVNSLKRKLANCERRMNERLGKIEGRH